MLCCFKISLQKISAYYSYFLLSHNLKVDYSGDFRGGNITQRWFRGGSRNLGRGFFIKCTQSVRKILGDHTHLIINCNNLDCDSDIKITKEIRTDTNKVRGFSQRKHLEEPSFWDVCLQNQLQVCRSLV